MPRKLFVTTALPYANGPLHIGHLMEHIQADIWVRFQRMQGHDVKFACADDAHGASIMIAAEKAGITPQQYGHSCENCGAVYAPTELKNPYSTLSGAAPVMKSSQHYFFQLSSPRC